MTDRENEEQKCRTRYALQDNRQIKDVHPEVASIAITYTVEHRSAFGIARDERTMTLLSDHTNNYEVDCLNRECTTGYFDLKSEVWDMIRSKATERIGSMRCKGSEAPDHMYQSCGGTLEYTIRISYK